MKKSVSYLLAATLLASSITSCTTANTSDSGYLGTMAGAEIGGTIGEAIGWMATSRHDGPGKAMLGSIIGTVAGAAIGHSVATKKESKPIGRKIEKAGSQQPDYQTSGGYGQPSSDRQNLNAVGDAVSIHNLTYQDEDGDGLFSRYETLNIIYEVSNNSNRRVEVELSIDAQQPTRDIVFSPSNIAILEPHQTIRYKAKAFSKNRLHQNQIVIVAQAKGFEHGNATARLRIPCAR